MIIAKIINDDENITLDDLTKKIKDDSVIAECGAIFTFEGIVRGKDESKTTDKITLTSSDPEKTEKELETILKDVKKTHKIKSIAVVHYLGQFEPGDPMFLAAVAGAHRHETRAALEEIIERVKYELDFKKVEEGSAGSNIIMSGG
ncbi:molybdenum cofactor biosynthesis protein MoaE [Methanobacterium petrolearium]|uniref:molybdenum cofactor biosynthesis protein MoaE n=1 Tax=Methanobacterium petrolearium TaxID=710190 RepID=UPI001AE1CDCA|nr:molybdenum cofactor biosynthesis protein MoaE [Methanobacterium petrolearium]MBP1945356.1 molybdopterin synthase catalytic subunit [Methanobacterium petrolearium]BDZ71545.1 molybdenum cofactor biosynthesis protein MoaE [Methanobacterium petrolearium]